MKLLTVLAALLLAAPALALNENSSWEEIDASYDYAINTAQATVTLEGVRVSVFNVCTDGAQLRTVSPITYCAKYDTKYVCENGQSVCRRNERVRVVTCTEYATRNLAGGNKKSTCTKYVKVPSEPRRCVAWKESTVAPKTRYDIDVLYTKSNSRRNDIAFTKTYYVPSCRN